MHRAAAASRKPRELATAVAGTVAGAAGRAVGWVRRSVLVRSAPGVAGAVAISIGLSEIYRPLLLISLGVFALILDNRAA